MAETPTKEHFMHLQHSEAVVAGMAATIFVGLLQNVTLTADNEDGLVAQSVAWLSNWQTAPRN